MSKSFMRCVPSICFALLCLRTDLAFADLLKCPECANVVSDKAAACPKCGATIEFIKKSLEATVRTNATVKTDYRNCAVRIQSDTANGFGVAVEHNDKKFIICDHGLIEGAESLEISPTSTNVPVRYQHLELATDRPLVRFATDSTNILYLPMSPASGLNANRALAFSLVLTNGQVIANEVEVVAQNLKRISIEPTPKRLLCICDTRTNVVAIAPSKTTENVAWRISSEIQWIAVRPLDFRTQTRLLREAEQLSTNEKGDQRRLREVKRVLESTEWLTKYLHERAGAVLRREAQSQ